MKVTNVPVSNALREVWEWKEAVYEDVKDMTFEEKQAYFRNGMEEAARTIGARLVRNPDGTCVFV